MINGLEGIPGSGKSYEGVAHHVLPALQAGRKVITNLPLNIDAFAAIDPGYRDLIEIRTRPAPRLGEWNAANIAEQDAFQLWKDRDPEPQPENVFTFGTVWDFYSTWRGPKGEGPLYVIDECHVSFPKLGTPESVVQWFKLHRHFNAEVLLMTQSFRDINQPIAQLIATLIKCRKADIMGKKGSYIRKVHAGYRGAVIQTSERDYKPQYFGLYRSNTQSGGSAESGITDVNPFLVKFNRVKWVAVAVSLGLCVWAFWPKDDVGFFGNRTIPAKGVSTAAKPVASAPVAAADVPKVKAASTDQSTRADSDQVNSDKAKAEKDSKEPLHGKNIHVTGEIRKQGRHWYTFVVSDGSRRMFDLNSDDMRDAGYQVEYRTHCIAKLTWEGGGSRMVTCDSPVATAGTDNKPIVIDSGGGGRSDKPLRTMQPGQGQDAPEYTTVPMPEVKPRPANEVTLHDVTRAARTGRLNELGQL